MSKQGRVNEWAEEQFKAYDKEKQAQASLQALADREMETKGRLTLATRGAISKSDREIARLHVSCEIAVHLQAIQRTAKTGNLSLDIPGVVTIHEIWGKYQEDLTT